MTSSRMENPLWKKLQNDPSLLKFQQQLSNNNTEANNNLLSVNELNRNSNILGMNELILDNNNSTNELNSLQSLILNSNSNNNNNNSMMPHSMPSQLSPDSLGLLKQHQMQPTTSSYASLIEHQNQQLQQLQQFINNSQKISTPDVQPSVATSAQYFTDNTELNLNQLLMVNEMNSLGDSFQNDNGNYPSFNLNSIKKQQQQQLHQQQQQHLMSRERGIIEKIVGSYGFVKCLDRDGRLFFHYSSFQNNDNNNTELTTSLKVGDFVEFEEGVDKRNGKPIAINLNRLDIKTSTTNSMKSSNQHDQLSSIDSSLNLMNLKELLLKNGSASGVGGGSTTSENLLLLHQQQQHQNYQAIMNGLKVLNMQNLATNNNNSEDTTANNLNSIMNLFNKENIFNNTNNNNNNLNQMNINTNILNMAKAAATTSSTTTTSSVPSSLSNGNDNLANLVKMFNVNTNLNNNNNTNLDMKQQQKNDEQMEGTVAIVATKRPSPSVSSSSILLAQQLDGRITYQRSGETFYIPYSLSDVVNTNVQLRIGDRVKFYIAHLLNNNSSNNNLLQQQQHLPVVTTYYARKVEVISHDYNLSINELAQHLLLAQQQQQQFQQQQAKQVYRGIITTLKDSFGKIEREDQFKETFFHFSEYRGPNANQELRLGLNVEFELQDRHGKEIACNIRMLTQQGTLTFDELSTQVYIGRIIQPLTKITNATNLNGINLVSLSGTNFSSIGRLIYDSNTSNNNNNNNSNMNNNGESLVELSFTDRDRCDGAGEYTWLEGDFVQFRIASDKRRKTCKPQQLQLGLYQRATQMTLIEEHSLVENSINTNEHRERGVLVKLYNSKDLLPAAVAAALMENDINVNNNINKYGAIQCLEQNDLVYFSLSEVISYVRFSTTSKTTTNYSVNEVKLQVGDSLEFSVTKCQKDFIFKNGLKAIRLRQLAKNSVQFEVVSTETYNGLIEREAINSSNTTDNSSLTGLIRLDYKNGTSSNKNNNSQTINFNYTNEQSFNIGDKVKFNICTCLKTKKQTAVDLKLVEAFKEQGIITAIVSKDSIGSIELLSLNKNNNNNNNKQQKVIQREILFKANSLASVTFSDLNIGDHVEFNVNKKNLQNIFAENLTKIATKKSSFKIFSNLSTTVHKGRVTHQLKPHKSNNTVNISNLDEKKTQQQLDDDYFGKIQIVTSSNERKESVGSVNDSSSYQFGLFSLNDKKFLLQVGDLVSFQLGTCFDGTKKAANIQYIAENQQQQSNQSRQRNNNNNNTNEFKKGKIDSIKGHCGFIEYTTNNDDRKKIFFHISDLTDENGNGSESSNVKIGDEVEFILMHNSRSGKYSAVKIKRLASKTTSNSDNSQVTSVNNNNGSADQLNETAKRPERLITKLKLANIDDKSGKQLILIRQPNNPDSKAKSFSRQLSERLAGSLEPLVVARQRKSEESSDSSDKETVDEPADHQQQQQQQIPSTMSIIDLLMANSSN